MRGITRGKSCGQGTNTPVVLYDIRSSLISTGNASHDCVVHVHSVLIPELHLKIGDNLSNKCEKQFECEAAVMNFDDIAL
jgi:hypothetical protein